MSNVGGCLFGMVVRADFLRLSFCLNSVVWERCAKVEIKVVVKMVVGVVVGGSAVMSDGGGAFVGS